MGRERGATPNTYDVSLVVGDHPMLSGVADDLRGRGDEVVRVAQPDESAEHAEVASVIADAAQVEVLVIGYAACDGTARRARSLVRSVSVSGGLGVAATVVLVS